MTRSISILIPTRYRPYRLLNLCASLKETAGAPDRVQVVLGVDDDDNYTRTFHFGGIDLVKVAGAPGRGRDEKLRQCLDAADGDIILFLHDNALMRTPHWDARLLRAFASGAGHGLAVFDETACVLACTREACLALARTPGDVARRLLLLSQHEKGRTLNLDLTIERQYGDSLGESEILEPLVPDANADAETIRLLREPERRSVVEVSTDEATPRVTIAVIAADTARDHARRCLESIKRHTDNYELVLIENNYPPDFNHAREMNRILDMARTRYVVLLDDDAFASPGWLPGLLKAMDDETAVVCPVHEDLEGRLIYSGAYFYGDDYGTHRHHLDLPESPRPVQCLCSAIMLVDREKIPAVRFGEMYRKYFHDLDFGLQAWEAGYKVVCTPDVRMVHIGGGAMPQGMTQGQLAWNADMQTFRDIWLGPGRMRRVADAQWSNVPFLHELYTLPQVMDALFASPPADKTFLERLDEVLVRATPYPLLLCRAIKKMMRLLKESHRAGRSELAAAVNDRLAERRNAPYFANGYNPFIAEVCNGFKIVDRRESVYAVPMVYGPLDFSNDENLALAGVFKGPSVEAVRDRIVHEKQEELWDLIRRDAGDAAPIPVGDSFPGVSIHLYGKWYMALAENLQATPQTLRDAAASGACSLYYRQLLAVLRERRESTE